MSFPIAATASKLTTCQDLKKGQQMGRTLISEHENGKNVGEGRATHVGSHVHIFTSRLWTR